MPYFPSRSEEAEAWAMERQADAQHLRLLVERSQKLRAFGDDLGEVWGEARGPMNPERYQRLRSMIEKLLTRVRG